MGQRARTRQQSTSGKGRIKSEIGNETLESKTVSRRKDFFNKIIRFRYYCKRTVPHHADYNHDLIVIVIFFKAIFIILKVIPVPGNPQPPQSTGFRSKIKRVFRSTSGPDRSFSLVSQLTSAALCASTPALPKPGESPPVVKSLNRPLSVPQLRYE